MKWTEISAGELHAAEQRLRVALGDEAGSVVKRFNTDPAFVNLAASKIVAMMREITGKKLTSLNPQWLRAREIMGKNMFGVEEAIRYFGVNPTRRQVLVLSEIPSRLSEEVFQNVKDTHVLVAVFPLSILEIRAIVNSSCSTFDFADYEERPFTQESFAGECGKTNWYLIRKTKLKKSLQIDRGDVQSARVMVYTIMGHYLATGEKLFDGEFIDTSSVDSDGRSLYVGFHYFESIMGGSKSFRVLPHKVN